MESIALVTKPDQYLRNGLPLSRTNGPPVEARLQTRSPRKKHQSEDAGALSDLRTGETQFTRVISAAGPDRMLRRIFRDAIIAHADGVARKCREGHWALDSWLT
jgi:hypothetical protein